MRGEFYHSYGELHESYRRGLAADEASRSALSWTAEAIDRAVADLRIGRRLRPDARLFLLVNLHQMVVLPQAKAGSFSPEKLHGIVDADLRSILGRAREQAEGGGEISSHSVLTAIADLWKGLHCMADGAWSAA